VTNLNGIITGIQRTWLDPRRSTKAPLADPRRALGHLLGNGVRFGAATKPALAQAGVLAAGEGIETMLALKSVLPSLPVVAGLSATHLAALDLSPRFRPGAGCAGFMSPATMTRPVSKRRTACTNAASPSASRSASSCRSMVISTSIFVSSAPPACSRILQTSSCLMIACVFGSLRRAVDHGAISGLQPVTGRKEQHFLAGGAPSPATARATQAAFPSGDLPSARPGCNGAGQLFSAAGLIIQRIRAIGSPRSARLCSAKQNSCPAPSSALLRPQGGCNPGSAAGG
jgi:hypothetical protein